MSRNPRTGVPVPAHGRAGGPSNICIKDLRRVPHPIVPGTQTRKPPQSVRQAKGHFLKGPVPLAWLSTAAQLPGRALHVGVVLWYLAGLKRTRTFKLTNAAVADLAVDRHAKQRALKALEYAGLVAVARTPGRSPIVTLLPDGKAAE